MEALRFGLKFATGITYHDMGKLINIKYRHYDSDFHKGFVQGFIAAKEIKQPRRYIAALKSLSSDHNFTISPSDKGGSVVVMDSSADN